MIPIASVASKSARNLRDSSFVKFALKFLERPKNVTIVINYSAKDALKIGYNLTRTALAVIRILE